MQKYLKFLLLTITLFFCLHTHAETFTIKTNAFKNKNIFSVIYTCDGKDISPLVSWVGAPIQTKAFALILSDPDAPNGTWYHWIVYNIPSHIQQLTENSSLPAGALTGKNSWDKSQYNGPCPPNGATHRYIFTLYALDSILNLSNNENINNVLSQINNHVVRKAEVMGVYK
jgi:Raf kinase inhibitor-like YbhB/YbcL family protein